VKKINSVILISSIALLVIFITSFTYLKKHERLEKMNQLYQEGLKEAFNKENTFTPGAEMAYYDSILAMPANSPKSIFMARYFKARDHLKLGEEQKAINIMLDLLNNTPGLPDLLKNDIQKNLAISYLRMGERTNCISNHSGGSCIFPIQGKGVYVDPTYSQKGIELYKELLRQNPNDLESRWLLNVAYMTIGEYPGQVPADQLIPGLDTDTSSIKVHAFKDMAGPLKLNTFRNMAGGSIVEDFDNDGYLDIVTSCWGLKSGMHFFRNNSDGTFTDVSEQSGLDKIKGGLNIMQADYNNDGFVDILVLRGAWLAKFGNQPNSLLRNNGDGTFTDVTIESGLLSFHPTQTATWADFNNDGWLDLFIGNETVSPEHPNPSELYINNQDGTFTNVSGKSGCEQEGFMKGVTSADYNNDGWPDIFISMLDGRKMLLKNKGLKSNIPQFEDVTHEAGLDLQPTFTFPTWFWDYNNDGWPDIFVCGYDFQGSLAKVVAADALNKPTGNSSKMYLYRNNRDGTFTDVTMEAGLDHPVFAMGANFGDIDNDGWPDMYLGTGNPDYRSLIPNKMYKNVGGKRFVDVTSSARVGNLQKGHGVAFADINNDGNQDIFIEMGGAFPGDAYYNSLYVNPGQDNNNWVSILLEGSTSNRSAIGARIAVTFTEDGKKRTVYRDVNSGGSFGASPFRKEIGIGKATVIDELIIKWPTSGTVQVFKNVKPCQFLRIKENSDQVEKMDLKMLNFDDPKITRNMIDCAPVKF
jgi:FG-GAP-like repeat/ASPIC and UnbV